jgi:serine/threonine protein kinase
MDIWAMGVVLYVMLFGHHPFSGNSKQEIRQKVIENQPLFPKDIIISNECKDILLKMLEKKSSERITMI